MSTKLCFEKKNRHPGNIFMHKRNKPNEFKMFFANFSD